MKPYFVDLELRPQITVVKGFSGSGKSLICGWLAIQKMLPENTGIYDHVVIFNYLSSNIGTMTALNSKLIVIDNADILLENQPRLLNHIASDMSNQYLIMARCPLDLGLSPNYYATLVEEGKRFSLDYRFSVKGWY